MERVVRCNKDTVVCSSRRLEFGGMWYKLMKIQSLQWYTRNTGYPTKKREEDVQKGKIEEPKVWNFEAFIFERNFDKKEREKEKKR